MAKLKRERVRVAVIGVGNMGRNHARVLSQMQDVTLVAVSDIDQRRGKKVAQEFQCSFWKDYKEMLSKEQIDAVSITVSTPLHGEVGLHVISQKKHVMMEKPIALNSKEARLLIHAAKKHNVKLAVGHVERFNPAVQELQRIVQKGELGEITSLVTQRVGGFPPQTKGVNVISDLAVHDIDIYRYLLDRHPDSVFARGRRVLIPDQEDSAELMLSYGPITGFIQVNWITPVKIRTLSVTGSKGFAYVNYITQRLELYKSQFKRDINDFGDFVATLGEPEKREISVPKKEPLLAELENFVQSIQNSAEPLVTGGEGLEALKTVESAIKSIKDKAVIPYRA